MKPRIVHIDKPGAHSFVVLFNRVGQEREWVGVVRAMTPGTYNLSVTAEHSARGTRGRITVKAVATKGAVVNIRGMIKIHTAAQQTDDFLELRVLTLDPAARATAEPGLEIEADDVKASHAASVGPVDPEQLLYLQSRGLDEKQAKESIVEGFLEVG